MGTGSLRSSRQTLLVQRLLSCNTLVLHVSGVAQFTQPVGIRLLGLALANRLTRSVQLLLHGTFRVAPSEQLDQVITVLAANRIADLTVFQVVHGALEFRHGFTRADPAEIPALRRRTVLRISPREVGEIAALLNVTLDIEQLLTGGRLGHAVGYAQQNVPDVGLHELGCISGLALACAALHQLDDLKAAIGANQFRIHLVRTERSN